MSKVYSSAILLFFGFQLTPLSAEPLKLSKEYWQDPSFVKSFNGSYRINARIEPYVTSEQRAVLLSVQTSMAKGNREEALGILRNSSLTKNSAALLYNQANIEYELGKNEDAIKNYRAALKLYPSFRRAHKNLGAVLMREDQLANAEKSLLEAMELGDTSGTTLGLLGYCHLQNKKYASALQSYRMAQITQPDALEWKAGSAQCLIELNQLDEAAAILKEAVEARPEEVGYQLLLVDVFLRQDAHTKGIARLEWLRKQDKLKLDHLSLLAQLYIREDLVRLAKPILEEVKQQLTIDNLPSFLNCMTALLQLQQYELTLELAEAANVLELSKKDDKKVFRMSAIANFHSNKEGAIGVLEQIIKTDPTDGEVLLILAQHQHKSGNDELAAMYYERAIQSPAHKYTALLEYGKMLVAQKKYDIALEKLDAAVKLRPSKDLSKYITAVESIAESWN